jgi:hypothetical protein
VAVVGDGYLNHHSPPVLGFSLVPYDTPSLTFLPLPANLPHPAKKA